MSPCQARAPPRFVRGFWPAPPVAATLRGLLLHRFASRPSVLLSASSFGPSVHAVLLWPLLTSAYPSQDLAVPVALRHVCRSPRVLHTYLHAYARRIYVTAFRTCIGLCIFPPAHPTVLPLSASCSSDQRFAFGFLQTPGHPGHRCLPLTLALVGCVEDFHLQVSAPCRAHGRPAGVQRRCAALSNSAFCLSGVRILGGSAPYIPPTCCADRVKLARPERFELPTSWFVGSGSMERKSMFFSSDLRAQSV